MGWDVGRRLDGHKVENGWTAKELLTLGEKPAGVGLALKLIETARAVLGVARAIRSLARHPKSRTQAINALKGCWSLPATSSASS